MRLGRNDTETAELAGIYRQLIRDRTEVNTSLGVVAEMLYYNKVSSRTGFPDTPIEAHADMKWFRSNIRLGSRLALFALATQFLLSFGHFHGSSAQASASVDAKRSGLHDTVGSAVAQLNALDRTAHANASRPVRLTTSSGQVPDGQPTDDCAICAVMALANATVVATPPCLLAPQASAFLYSIPEAEFVDPNSVRAAFQPRAPPIA